MILLKVKKDCKAAKTEDKNSKINFAQAITNMELIAQNYNIKLGSSHKLILICSDCFYVFMIYFYNRSIMYF